MCGYMKSRFEVSRGVCSARVERRGVHHPINNRTTLRPAFFFFCIVFFSGEQESAGGLTRARVLCIAYREYEHEKNQGGCGWSLCREWSVVVYTCERANERPYLHMT